MTDGGAAIRTRHARLVTSGFGSSAVAIAGVAGRGLFTTEQVPDVDRAGEPVLRSERVLFLAAADWPDVRPQQTATIEGTDYLLVGPAMAADDGALVRYTLRPS